MSDALGLPYPVIQFEKALMRAVHIAARAREEAGLAAAFCAKSLVLALHSIHVCSRRAHIRYISRIPGKFIERRDLLKNRLLAAGLDELALMSCDGTEITSAKTSSVSIHRELDHFESRDMLTLVPWMRKFGEGQVPI